MAASPQDRELYEILGEVRRVEIQSRRLVTEVLAGSYHSVFRGSGIEFDEIREYLEGDDPRSVDWNVTARVGTPHVKQFVDERAMTVMFVVDRSPTMDAGFAQLSSRQMAARICACLALSAVRNNDRVGAVSKLQGARPDFVPPKPGASHALRIVRDCLSLPSDGAGSGGLAQALEFAAGALRRRSTLFLLSDFLSDGWSRALRLCARHHDVVAVRLLPPEAQDVPEGRLMHLRDPVGGERSTVDWSDPRLRETYRDALAAWNQRVVSELRSAEVDLMDVPLPKTEDPGAVARPILEFFRMRELRRNRR